MNAIRESSLSQRPSNSRGGGGARMGSTGGRGSGGGRFGRGRSGMARAMPDVPTGLPDGSTMGGSGVRPAGGGAPANSAVAVKSLPMPGGVQPSANADSNVMRGGSGGTMTRGGVTTDVAPSSPTDALPSSLRPNSGGTMTKDGQTTVVPGAQFPAPGAGKGPENSDPLSGDGNTAPTGKVSSFTPAGVAATTQATLDHGRALGYSQKGAGTPSGSDITQAPSQPGGGDDSAAPDTSAAGPQGTGSFSGGTGKTSPVAGNIYRDYSKRLFGTPNATPAGKSGLKKAKGMSPQTDDQDNGGADEGNGS